MGKAASAKRYPFTGFLVYDMNLTPESPLKTTARFENPEKDLGFWELSQKIEALRGDARARARRPRIARASWVYPFGDVDSSTASR